ncbi:MAG TPA: hypothetical protein VMT61_14705 [Candidatus Binataceae bacterium]|nr:hypothetical protein [Candidatus Binataceae bacterium]
MKLATFSINLALAIVFEIVMVPSADARPLAREAQAVIDRLVAVPVITPEPGFSAKMLIAPGELYDPLFMVPRGTTILLNDDGKATDGHGSRVLSVTPEGKLSVLMDADQLLPVAGFDLAPQSFGNFGGQLFSLAQPTTGMKGALANHVIQRIDLATHTASVFCTLPNAGSVGKGIPGYGFDAHFGPAGSRFANIFYSLTVLNDMIYQTFPDGSCKAFVDTSQFGSHAALTYTGDGSAMLVAMAPEALPSAASTAKGVIMRISSDGKIDSKPIARGLVGPAGIAVAPPGFGNYGGEIFVADSGDLRVPVPQTQTLKRDGKIFRVTPDGELRLVASGFINPSGLRFIGKHLWVTDVNGDFVAGMRELPDGFLVQLDAM